MVRLRLGALVVAGIALGALSGCAAATHSDGEPPRTHAQGSPSSVVATPTPTPTPIAADELTISANGIGPLQIGTSVTPSEALALSIKFNAQHCGYYPDWEGIDVTTAPFALAISGKTSTSPVVELGVSSGSPVHTAEGIRIGSTLSELKSAYPSLVLASSTSAQSSLYVLNGTYGKLVFEVANANYGGDSNGGQPNTVLFMTVQPLAAKPDSFAGSDVSVGGCS